MAQNGLCLAAKGRNQARPLPAHLKGGAQPLECRHRGHRAVLPRAISRGGPAPAPGTEGTQLGSTMVTCVGWEAMFSLWDSQGPLTQGPDRRPGGQIGKGVCQGCILSPCLFNFNAEYIMRNAGLEEAQLESRLPGEISVTSDMQMTPPLWQKVN